MMAVHGSIENPQANENPKAIHGKFLLEEKSKILPTQRTDRVKSVFERMPNPFSQYL